MSILKLQDALKTIIIDQGEDVFNDPRKTKALLSDYTGDENRDEVKQLILMLENNTHLSILNQKDFDDQEQVLFIRTTIAASYQSNYQIANTVLEMLFTVFYECNLIRRKIIKNKVGNIIDLKIEVWKKKLLDLGKRNRLINYKDTKRSSLRFVSPALEELWSKVVVKGRPLELPYIDEFDENAISKEMEKQQKRNITTNQSLIDQQKTLRNLKTRAKSINEEQGVNVLHIAFGFLKWKENNDSREFIFSPLILVPANITQKSMFGPFILTADSDDIIVNPTLSYKLENDFGIKFPEFDVDNDINAFFDDISSKIKNVSNWAVSNEVVLSLFSFLKINMYNDLSRNNMKIKKNPAIKALTGDSSELMDPLSINPQEYEHDSRNPQDFFQVLDADSSQQDAIVSAKKGLSFVLQGPPGSGKSQTIANIIAECLAKDKKVLFVSEKAAALDVVYRRLLKAGLSDFCLSLHSYKSNKKDIIDNIGKNIGLKVKKQSNNEDNIIYTKLVNDIKHLNEYSSGLHTKLSGMQKTIYDVYGELMKLDTYMDLPFSFLNIELLTLKDFDDIQIRIHTYSSTFDNYSSDFQTTPWKGFKNINITYDFSDKLEKNLEELYRCLLDITPLNNEIITSFALKTAYPEELLEILNVFSKAVLIYESWLSKNNIEKLQIKSADLKNQFNAFKAKLLMVNNYLMENTDLHFSVGSEKIKSIKTFSEFNDLFESFKFYVRSDTCFSIWEQSNIFPKVKVLFEKITEQVNTVRKLKEEILSKYEDAIFKIDAKSIIKRFQMEYTSILKIFKKQYKLDRNEVIKCHKVITKETLKIKDAYIISDLQAILKIIDIENWFVLNKEIQNDYFSSILKGTNTDIEYLNNKINEFEKIIYLEELFTEIHQIFTSITKFEKQIKGYLLSYYNGIDTNWNIVKNALSWAQKFLLLINKYNLPKECIEKVCIENNISNISNNYLIAYTEKYNNSKTLLDWFFNLFEDGMFNNKDIIFITDTIKCCKEKISDLEKYIDYKIEKNKCLSMGLSSFIEMIEFGDYKKEDILPIFKKYFYKLWLDNEKFKFESINKFKSTNHEKIITEYKELDRKQLENTTSRIQEKLINNYSPLLNKYLTSGEIKILLHEMHKKRRIMPIRKLFQSIPNLLLMLKPCLMMSPLTVSLFLESDNFIFDTIIFDEASQVCTENAIGAIIRGKQVILAGDSKQLPPTAFFTAATSDNDFDDEDQDDYTDIYSYESILDEAESSSFPSQTLRWHYRSRHEHLIAFSNSFIYANKLITFPSNKDRSPDNGVEYIFVQNGIYDKGGRRDNIEEAKITVDLIFDNIKKYPDRSLGVITFSVAQRDAIDTQLRKRLLYDNRFESYFSEDKEEAFFIKNIETVQGDERDTIIFSICYAKDHSGKMSMNFGPLSSQGGERRLNVAITRAKFNVKLVGSIIPADIKSDRISSEGPKLLRQYIDFAINGPKVLNNVITVNDTIQIESYFEQSVYDFLIENGFDIATQVGCSGYRIDMAVRNPNDRLSFCLGIECDGATYHSARTARERDRLRQTILEDMGWKIYRIWSTEWIKNTKSEKEKLLKAVKSALEHV
jgi:superfamily I DNA and/or RNA helicase/very-short-patch-repair endonuclease